jgi:hypothetical protein
MFGKKQFYFYQAKAIKQNEKVAETALEHLQLQTQLLKLEKETERELYARLVRKGSIKERKREGLTWYPVEVVRTEYGLGEYLIFEIEKRDHDGTAHQFSVGKTVELFGGPDAEEGSVVKGVVKSLHRHKMVIATTTDEAPDWMDDGRIGVNIVFDEYSFREMEQALKRAMLAEVGRLRHLRETLYGERAATFTPITLSEVEGLNVRQHEALELCLGAESVAIIHGPPGTGKTTTLVEVIVHLCRTESQVLVCSPSNLAVDLLAEKLARRGLQVLRLGNPTRVSDELLQLTLDGKVMAHPGYAELKNYRKMAEEYKAMARKYKRSFGPSEREQRQLLFAESKAILREASALEDYMVAQQINGAQVVCCTLVGSASHYLANRTFQTLVIDEAAQALEPACWIPLAKAQRVLFAGDHKQLPPTIKSEEAARKGLGITLMEKAIKANPCSVMLEEQYRMNAAIMAFPNQELYNGKLVAFPGVANHSLFGDDSAENQVMEFIDTAGCGFTEVVNPETFSACNPEEAGLLMRHLAHLVETLQQRPDADAHTSIGIISPYKEQVQVLHELVADHPLLGSLKNLTIRTVDGFQGREKDVIYLSLVRSNDLQEIGFLKDIRRLNVALTRARKKLVVIGDSATITSHPTYERFCTFCYEQGWAKSAWDYKVFE